MTTVMLGLLVAVLFACGAYLISQRGQIKLILGLGLFTHAVNLVLFGSGKLTRGAPPILPHTDNVSELLATQTYADPLPQALILTAIVISFGITAFIVVLVSRRDAFTGSDLAPGELAPFLSSPDPFLSTAAQPGAIEAAEDFDIFQTELLQTELDEVYDRPEAEAEIAHEELPGAEDNGADSQAGATEMLDSERPEF